MAGWPGFLFVLDRNSDARIKEPSREAEESRAEESSKVLNVATLVCFVWSVGVRVVVSCVAPVARVEESMGRMVASSEKGLHRPKKRGICVQSLKIRVLCTMFVICK